MVLTTGSQTAPVEEVIPVSSSVASPPDHHPPKPLLGLRRKPGRLALAVFRMPVRAYRHDAGWFLGRAFLLLIHTGRRTGRPHSTVAMVLRYDPDPHEAVICSAWGPDADWVRNIHAGPAVRVQLGRESYTPEHRFLSEDESFEVAAHFRREHPWRLRLVSTILGWGDLRHDDTAREFIRTHPFVGLRPALGAEAPERSCAP
jgi:deazaflavin-dependent oxidoreductase (nitroreductase family)